MATKARTKGHVIQEQEQPEVDPNARDVRVDEFAFEVFRSLGYTNPLPPELVETYQDFKRLQDTLHSGRLSPESFATVVMLSRLKR